MVAISHTEIDENYANFSFNIKAKTILIVLKNVSCLGLCRTTKKYKRGCHVKSKAGQYALQHFKFDPVFKFDATFYRLDLSDTRNGWTDWYQK